MSDIPEFKLPKLPTIGAMSKRTPKRLGSAELTQIANDAGFGQEAQKINESFGEQPDEIFSGGLISDMFDLLNIVDFGLIGMLKGKSFSEGVRTRESFSKQDSLGQYGLLGTVAGIAADIAVTWPLWMVASPFKILSKLGIVGKGKKLAKGIFSVGEFSEEAGKFIPKIAENRVQKAGQWFTNKVIGAMGADSVFGRAMTDNIISKSFQSDRIIGSAKVLLNAGDEVSSKFPDMFRRLPNGALGLIDAQDLPRLFDGDNLKAAQELWKKTAEIQIDAVNLGLLKAGDDSYVANLYSAFENSNKLTGLPTKPLRTRGTRFAKKRKLVYETPEELAQKASKLADDLIKEGASKEDVAGAVGKLMDDAAKNKEAVLKARQELGEISDSLYPVLKGLTQATTDIENAKLFRELSKSHAFTEEIAEKIGVSLDGMVKLGDAPKNGINRLGDLAGKYVPKHVADEINELTKVTSDFEKAVGAAWGFFKWGHTAGNPAGHVRNMFSNQILNYWKLGMVPGTPQALKAQAIAAKEMAKSGKFIKEARKLGYNVNTFASAELKSIINSVDMAKAQKGFTPKAKKALRGIMNKTSDLYQASENHAKLSAYIYNRTTKGMNPEKAWELAMAATFDYNSLGPIVRQLRSKIWGVPFLSFSVKAAPLVAETALKTPQRISVIGKIKNAIENMSDIETLKRERAAEPDYVKDGFFVRLPMKDKNGRSAYFDMTYIIPFGDLISGQILQRQRDMDTGVKESFADAIMNKAPLLNLLSEISRNQDFTGQRIWRDSDSIDDQIVDLTRHIMKMYLPPVVAEQLQGGHYADGRKAGQRRPSGIQRMFGNVEGTQQRNAVQEALRHLGMKIQPVSADISEYYQEMTKTKALTTLLGDQGVVREYSRIYKPKNQ